MDEPGPSGNGEEGGHEVFTPGIYYLQADPSDHDIVTDLVHLETGTWPGVEVLPVGYDLRPDRLVYTDSRRRIYLVSPAGGMTEVEVQGIHSLDRPSFSPDGRRVAVQALEEGSEIGAGSEDLNIYIVDLETGETLRVSHRPINEESPVWIPGTETVAYSSFDPEDGVHLHVVNATNGEHVTTHRDAGELHVDVSGDGELFVQGPQLRVYWTQDGSLFADLLEPALKGLREAGYEPLPNRGGNPFQDTFPLAASFSPDGDTLVLDGAVSDGNQEGFVLARIGIDGTGFELLTDLIPVDDPEGTQHNFSPVDPRWL